MEGEKLSAAFKVKRMVAGTSLLALGVAFEFISKHSREMKEEIEDWEEGRIVCLGVLPDGPSIAVRKELDRLVYLGRGDHGAGLKILFKNVDSALMPLIGQIGAHTAFAEHRAIVHGGIYEAMQANRAMAIVVKFLFPGILLNRITKRPPKMTGADYVTYARLNAVLVLLLLANWRK
jgi:hypothetical protein